MVFEKTVQVEIVCFTRYSPEVVAVKVADVAAEISTPFFCHCTELAEDDCKLTEPPIQKFTLPRAVTTGALSFTRLMAMLFETTEQLKAF